MGFELAKGVRLFPSSPSIPIPIFPPPQLTNPPPLSPSPSQTYSLPLDPVLVAISELLPKIQETQPLVGAPSEKVFNILKDVELGDVLPPAPPIMPRRFQVRPPF